MARTRFQARERVKKSHIAFQGLIAQKEMEGPTYMET